MNLVKSKLRRYTAVVAGAFLGLVGVAVFATPASAHHSVVSGSPKCDSKTGDWVVTWTVDTVAPPDVPNYRFIQADVAPADSPIKTVGDNIPPTITVTDTTPQSYPFTSNRTLTGEQRLPGDTTEASLTIRVEFNNGVREQEPHNATVKFDGTCTQDAPKPSAKLANTCEGVTVTLSNSPAAKLDAEFTVKGDNGFRKSAEVAPGKSVTVDIPAKDAAHVVVTEKHSDKPVLRGKYEQPKSCVPEDNADRYYEATCDSLIFTIDNTKGTAPVTATFTPNKGDAKTLTVKAGEKGSVTFKGVPGLEVVPSDNGQPGDAVKWDNEKPKTCGTTPPPSGGLPVTGAAAGSIAGGAAVLLGIGGVLFYLARRRRVKFTV